MLAGFECVREFWDGDQSCYDIMRLLNMRCHKNPPLFFAISLTIVLVAFLMMQQHVSVSGANHHWLRACYVIAITKAKP